MSYSVSTSGDHVLLDLSTLTAALRADYPDIHTQRQLEQFVRESFPFESECEQLLQEYQMRVIPCSGYWDMGKAQAARLDYIAKHVVAPARVVLTGEDSELFAIRFKDGAWEQQEPELTWPD